MHCKAKCVLRPLFRPSLPAVRLRVLSKTNDEKAVNYSSGYNTMESTSESESSKASSRPQSAVIPDDVVREFEVRSFHAKILECCIYLMHSVVSN